MNWHFAEQGRPAGPVTDAQLTQLFRDGVITADTPVWRDGLPDWIPFHQAELDPNPPPAVPPPLAARTPQDGEVVCTECGRIFPAGETIRYVNAHVCADCKPVFLQKLAEGARVNTGELNYAGFGIRFVARLVDGLILGLPFAVIFFIVVIQRIRTNPSGAQAEGPESFYFQLLPLLVQFSFIFIRLAYDTFFIGKFGATPGKMLCKIRVVTAQGARFGYGRAAGRCLAEILSALICYVGYLLVLFDNEKRALHDHLCSTRVIYK